MASEFDYQGISYPSWWNGRYASTESEASLNELVTTHANSISITPTRYVTDPTSSHIYSDPNKTESLYGVGDAIDDAHARGLTVMLKPHIDSVDGVWRAKFAPSDVRSWFADYKAAIVEYAKVAEAHHAEIFAIGTELTSLSGADYRDYWLDIISSVRAVYHGQLTYGANWDSARDISFWDKLDFVGVDAYVPLSTKADPTVADLVQGWTSAPTDPWLKHVFDGLSPADFYHQLSQSFGKPLLFTEVGYPSTDQAASRPFDTSYPGAPDQELQAKLYQALFQTWAVEKGNWMKGAFVWNWTTFADAQATDAHFAVDYTPQDKLAADVIQQWYGGTGVADAAAAAIVPALGHQTVMTLRVAGDVWQGDPQFSVLVDGQQVGGTFSTHAARRAGEWQDLHLTGDFGADGPHTVEIRFLNDAYGGSSTADRNLFVNRLDINGKHYDGAAAANTAGSTLGDGHTAAMWHAGSVTFTIDGASPDEGNTTAVNGTASGSDIFIGGNGNDRFAVGTGVNTLTGGAGHDMFVFSSPDAHDNIVTDYHKGEDQVDLRGIMQAIHYSGASPLADHVLSIAQVGANTIVQFDPDGDGAGLGHTVVTLQNVTASSLYVGTDILWH